MLPPEKRRKIFREDFMNTGTTILSFFLRTRRKDIAVVAESSAVVARWSITELCTVAFRRSITKSGTVASRRSIAKSPKWSICERRTFSSVEEAIIWSCMVASRMKIIKSGSIWTSCKVSTPSTAKSTETTHTIPSCEIASANIFGCVIQSHFANP
jgi:hypothetical protein